MTTSASPSLDEIVALAGKLSADDRELLLLRLQLEFDPSPVDPAIEAAWVAEAERRLDAVDRGEMASLPWREVRKELGLP
jgi:putative addiction module component (TIGR02574 family)